LENGVAVNDLSGISPDLNIDTEINNVQSITVYKSSAAVLYGGKAIGGAVDLETDYIPRQPQKLSNSKVFWKVELIAVRDRDFQRKVKLVKTGHGQ
jgi:iron complex outermembrane receptor protein